ncbi:Plasmodium exported protein (PHIST), unknown function [Plasmodium ovale wallikeri]|uniref:Plasmodium RESA N-terminal domain-containing protein n=1 Tax=Plasmodium ovale wallikeri TaxID=864142 RepID=A0A1A9AI72_PLAOA|nr:Plasmodium exported protein (PHIST), unknown function [Plasmodium ovale wallikeri]
MNMLLFTDYLLLQTIYTFTSDHYGSELLLRERFSRSLSGRIPSNVRGFRGLIYDEDREMVYTLNRENRRPAYYRQIDRRDENLKNAYLHSYLTAMSKSERERCKKNEKLFPCRGDEVFEVLTDDELNERIKNLKGPLHSRTMHHVWNYVLHHEKRKFLRMLEYVKSACKSFADYYDIPPSYEKIKWEYVEGKMLKELRKKEVYDFENIKDFASDVICARWEFQRYLTLKRRSWKKFTEDMEEKWTKKLLRWFKGHEYQRCSFLY